MLKAYYWLTFCVIVWGSNSVFGKILVQAFSPAVLTSLRLLFIVLSPRGDRHLILRIYFVVAKGDLEALFAKAELWSQTPFFVTAYSSPRALKIVPED